jgi:D-glycero-D-manno-heptose 1,7-bisphosphate phosphatase
MPFIDDHRWFDIRVGDAGPGSKRPAVFLDRDGVVIDEKHYIRNPADVDVLPGVREKIAEIRKLKVPIILVTNQSGIGRGLFEWADYHRVHERIVEVLGDPEAFEAVYANSYLPDQVPSDWRKPNPGMFLQAAKDLNVDLASSLMVGDKTIDLEAAHSAGVGHLVHVLTGHGKSQRTAVKNSFSQAVLIDSLADLSLEQVLPPLPNSTVTE